MYICWRVPEKTAELNLNYIAFWLQQQLFLLIHFLCSGKISLKWVFTALLQIADKTCAQPFWFSTLDVSTYNFFAFLRFPFPYLHFFSNVVEVSGFEYKADIKKKVEDYFPDITQIHGLVIMRVLPFWKDFLILFNSVWDEGYKWLLSFFHQC